jgi:hypothetical protein
MPLETEVKHPGETLDYAFDFTSDLEQSETITTQAVVSGWPSVTVSGVAEQDGKVVCFADGGVHGQTVPLVCTVETSANRTHVRVTYLLIRSDVR